MNDIDIKFKKTSNPSFYDLGYGNISLENITLDTCVSCYFENDIDYLIEFLNNKFSNSYNIQLLPLRFFKNFIDGQSNLYPNKFERYISGRDMNIVDYKEFNFSMEWIEKYFHILRESILYIQSPTEFTAIDASNYRTLDVNDYLIRSEGKYYRVNSIGVYERVYTKNKKGYTFEDVLIRSTNGVCPIVKLNDYGCYDPQINSLVVLEYNTISDISWGIYNASPKLLTQPVAKSDQPDDVVREGTKNFGRTTMMLKVGSGEEINTIDMGDLQNLNDLKKMYGELITEQAIRHGIDSYSVTFNPLATISSGESKKVELSYVNMARKKYFRMFNKFEKQVFETISKLFNLDITFEKIEFYDIEYGFLTTVPTTSETKKVDDTSTPDATQDEVVDVVETKVDESNDIKVEE